MTEPTMSLQPSRTDRIPEASSTPPPSSLNASTIHINDLPVEILSDIFILCFITNVPIAFEPGVTAAPSILLRVCRRWHDVALATGQLWNNLSAPRSIKVPTTEEDVRKLCEGMTRWLSRSRNFPLHLALMYPGRLVQMPNRPVVERSDLSDSDAEMEDDTQSLNTSTDEQHDSSDSESDMEEDPLDCELDEGLEEAQRAAAGQARDIFGVFVNFESRWESLQIIIDDLLIRDIHHYIRASLEETRNGRPLRMGQNLQYLKIVLDEDFTTSLAAGELQTEMEDLMEWIPTLPKLVSLSISDREFDTEKYTVSLFDRIKFVEFFRLGSYADLTKNVEFISRCKSANRLKLSATKVDHEWSYRHAAAHDLLSEAPLHLLSTLPNLVHLELHRLQQPLHCLRCLTLPSLLILDVDSGVAEDPATCDILEEFLTRSQCALRVLNITDHLLSAQNALEIYGLPALKSVPVVAFHRVVERARDIVAGIPYLDVIINAYQKRQQLPQFGLWGRWQRKISPYGSSSVPCNFHLVIGRPLFAHGSRQWFLGLYNSENKRFGYNQNYVKLVKELSDFGVIQRQNVQYYLRASSID